MLTSNSTATLSISVYARKQLVDFQDVGYGSRPRPWSSSSHYASIYLRLSRSGSTRWLRTMKRLRAAGFAALVAMIVAVSLFPFYYAIVSLTAPARDLAALLPHDLSLNYIVGSVATVAATS